MACNKKSDKYLKNPKLYICNPKTNRWVLRSSPIGKKLETPATENIIKYKTIKYLGKGGFGETLLIECCHDNKKLVMKKSLTKNKKIMNKQYNILKEVEKIGSDYFIKPVFLTKDGYEFAMEYAEDFIPLNEYFSNFISVKGKDRKMIGENLIKAVRLLHKNKIAHRDIKPANIMVNPKTNDVKLIDFGISCTEKQCIHENSAGTFIYMHPTMLNNYDETFKYYTNKLPYRLYKLYDEWALGLVLLRLSDDQFKNIIFEKVKNSHIMIRNLYKSKAIYEPILKEAQKSISKYFKYDILSKIKKK